MALIKTPDGGFYVNDDEFEVNYSTNSISLTGQGGGGAAGVASFNGRTGAVTPDHGDYTAALVGAVDKAGDTMTGDLDMSGNDVTGVHSVIAEGSTNSGLLFESNGTIVGVVTGGTRSATFTANSIDAYEHTISRVGEPLNDTDAARKQDVDAVQTAVDAVSETVDGIIDGTEFIPYLPDNGGTLTGPLNMGNNKITMGATPTATTDVTNKGYVDGVVKVVSDEVDGIIAGTTSISVPIATDTKVGGVKIGAGLSVDGEGTLSIAQTYESDIDMNSHSITNCTGLNFTGDPFIESDSTLGINVPTTGNNRATAMFATNINGIGLAQSDDYVYGMIVQNLEADSYQPTVGIGAIDTNGLTLESNYLANAKGMLVDYLGNIKFTSTNSIDFGNVNLTNVANPVNNTDVVNKQYADATYASVSSVPTNATTSQAGIVKQISNIAQLDASSATTEQIATTLNNLLTALQNAGIMSAN